jgi:putative exosortase-associated protein (TIGR04073 family)
MKSTRTFSWSIVLGVAVLAVCLAAPAQAYDMGNKACRGAAGLIAGFLELSGNMVETSNKQGVPMGLTAGFVKGVFMVPVREVIGIFELLTFPLEVKKGYEPLIDPEFPWDYFCGGEKAPAADKAKK